MNCAICQAPLELGAENCSACGIPVTGAALALTRGIELFSQFRYDGALREFELARQIAPKDLDVLRCHAHGLCHAGQSEPALAEYRRLLEVDPENIEVQYNVGQMLINQGRLDQARRIFEKLSETSAEFERDRFYLGFFFSEPQHFQADCYYYLAIVCWNRAETEAARHYFERALKHNPLHAAACHHLGNLHFQAKEYEQAVRRYSRYLDIDSERGIKLDDVVEVKCNLGIAHFETGKVDLAIETFKEVLQDRPGHPGAIYHMNLIYERQGLYNPKDYGSVPVVEDSDRASTIFGLSKREKPSSNGNSRHAEDDTRPIIGRSVAMQRVLRYARLAAASDATVLVTGENGTGKELIARAIHNNSPRRDRVFMPVNCAAIPENLIESELFGHEKGSFTGATGQMIGKFEGADRGTIFLDEIGDLDLNMQVKLLRVLQEREFTRVGGTQTVTVDVRIIAATNRNLEDLLAEGLFRQDLFFRLNVLPIRVPPLRERPEDIPLLAEHFVYKYGKGSVQRESLIGPDDMEVLMKYEWPGNIRELENVIERATVMGTQVVPILQGIAKRRRTRDEPSAIEISSGKAATTAPLSAEMSSRAHSSSSNHALTESPWEPLSIRDLERRHILQTLEHTSGNRTQAARLLGINPATLWRKMKTYEIAGAP